MPKGTFVVSHEQPPLTPLPERWESYWKDTLPKDAATLYPGLAAEEFKHAEVDADRFLRFYGMGASRFGRALRILEEKGFIWLDPDDEPPTIAVRPVPEVPPDATPPTREVASLSPRQQVWDFINHWSTLWDRHLGERYPRPTRGKNQDVYFLHKLLETYSVETLKQVADWFFLHRRAEERATIKYFWYHIEELVSDFKNKGGSIIFKQESLPQGADEPREDDLGR